MNCIEDLKYREIFNNCTNEEKFIYAIKNNKYVYCGFDPTSDSLHIGNLLQILLLKRLESYGLKIIAIFGEGTAKVGDPGGKNKERKLVLEQKIQQNAKSLKKQLKKYLPNAIIINNNDWLKDISLLHFLRNVGKHFNISYLISKDTIKNRISSGISYTEFSYNLIQAYDFLHLYSNYNCLVQVGGSDQWGNITSGLELINNIHDNSMASGLTTNLLLKPNGQKFGKTEKGTIWIDPQKTNMFDFFQFFYNQPDEEVIKLIKVFTFLSKIEITNIEQEHNIDPKKRHAQLILASEIFKFTYGENNLKNVLKIQQLFFNKKNDIELKKEDYQFIKNIVPSFIINKDDNLIEKIKINNIFKSNREIKEFIANNAFKINNKLVKNINLSIDEFIIYNKYLLIKKGKKNFYLLIIDSN